MRDIASMLKFEGDALRKRVTAVLKFSKPAFLREESAVARRLREVGGVEFQRVSNADDPNVELHVDFPTAEARDGFLLDPPSSLVTESSEWEVPEEKERPDPRLRFTLKDDANIEKADRALRTLKLRFDVVEGASGSVTYVFSDINSRNHAFQEVLKSIDRDKESSAWRRR